MHQSPSEANNIPKQNLSLIFGQEKGHTSIKLVYQVSRKVTLDLLQPQMLKKP